MVVKGRELNYGIGILDMVSIDLSFNQLTGRIPEEIAALDALMNLNLSRNQLSGTIPINLGAVQALESLFFFNRAKMRRSVHHVTCSFRVCDCEHPCDS